MPPFMKRTHALAMQEAEKETERKTAEGREDLEKMIDDGSREGAAVDVEEDFVAIDGIRLDRNNSRKSRHPLGTDSYFNIINGYGYRYKNFNQMPSRRPATVIGVTGLIPDR